MRPFPFIDSKGYDLEFAEPYLEENGEIGVMLLYNGHPNFKTVKEWTKEDKEIGGYLSKRFDKGHIFWSLPNRPNVDDDRDLHTDIMRAIDPSVDLHDDRLLPAYNIWLIGTAFHDLLPKSPHLILTGPTTSGKGRLLSFINLLAYRGGVQSNPTWAVMARMSGWYNMTFGLEETQDKEQDLTQIWNACKNAFDHMSHLLDVIRIIATLNGWILHQ